MLIRGRSSPPPPLWDSNRHDPDSILREGDTLQKQLDEWCVRATSALVVDRTKTSASLCGRLQRQLGASGGGDAAASSVVAANTASISGAASSNGAAAQCDPNGHPVTTVAPINPKYLMRPAAEVEKENPEFASQLAAHSNDKREIMLALANAVMICKNTTICWWNGGNILESFLEILERSNVTNHLIGVTDEETAKYLQDRAASRGAGAFAVNWFRPNVAIPASQANTREANRVSSLKFSLLQTSLQLGYHTMITDMDLVYLSNPFDALHRDADIESSSDGFDEMAYGHMSSIADPTMGWGGGGLYMQTFTINVGCAYLRATHRTFAVVKRAADELAAQPGWDQQVFNMHLLTQSHGDYSSPYATLRVMDIDKFVNSKRFFRSRRNAYIPGSRATAPTPVMVHFNYHPDKHARMVCIMDRYFRGQVDACDKFPGGSEPGTR
ncbi:hypothetical protein GPECTOR_42g773 [Gonium pectorale]|uniref:Nucleotide-diphospho-sugar transferase domain-containing protein n=1 Tax=Gonium pectorale TaxID=33097 RepID=A0A150G9P3_GONPE|nr:hypothetical protein GPECTOR_42g773 [Gonium pectorale]|eukprot:KXZ46564.1 hypothetical protein GPECTOR_42g773 [Gonium pectorale]